MTVTALLIPLLFPLMPTPAVGSASSCAGDYVEARTASVFAGACHYNGEFVTTGREAVCAWRIESGAYAGQDLAGVAIAAIVTAEANLDDHAAARRSSIVVDAGLAPERAAAAVRWLASTRSELLGAVIDVRSVPLAFERDGDAYAVVAGEAIDLRDTIELRGMIERRVLIELRGALLPDRACCAMPQNVWYTPLERLDAPLVGLDDAFRVHAPALGRDWSRPGENAAFAGRFGQH